MLVKTRKESRAEQLTGTDCRLLRHKCVNPKATCIPKQKGQNCFEKEQLVNYTPLLLVDSSELRPERELWDFIMQRSPVTLSGRVCWGCGEESLPAVGSKEKERGLETVRESKCTGMCDTGKQ